jgi:hypothetical protein
MEHSILREEDGQMLALAEGMLGDGREPAEGQVAQHEIQFGHLPRVEGLIEASAFHGGVEFLAWKHAPIRPRLRRQIGGHLQQSDHLGRSLAEAKPSAIGGNWHAEGVWRRCIGVKNPVGSSARNAEKVIYLAEDLVAT